MTTAARGRLCLWFAVALEATVALAGPAPASPHREPGAASRERALRTSSKRLSVVIQLTPAVLVAASPSDAPRAAAAERAVRALDAAGGPLRRALGAAGAANVRALPLLPGYVAEVPQRELAALRRRPDVASLVPEPRFRLADPAPSASAGLPASPDRLAALRLAALGGLGLDGAGVVVATLDTGVDPAHLALAGRWRAGVGGWFDPYGQQPLPVDLDGHGTSVLGVLAGAPVGDLPPGAAPGATWIAARVFDDTGDATLSGVLQALQWVLDPDGDPATDDAPALVNLSWGFDEAPGTCLAALAPAVRALTDAGILVVASAGSTGPGARSSVSPANLPGVVAVGALTDELEPVLGSGRGPGACDGRVFPDLGVPAQGVQTADLTFGGLLPAASALVEGTSFAAPVVAGLAALLLQAFPDARPDELARALREGAFELGPDGADMATGFGLPDATAAFEALRWRGSVLSRSASSAGSPPSGAVLFDRWRRELTLARGESAGPLLPVAGPAEAWAEPPLALTAWSGPAPSDPIQAAILERAPGRASLRVRLLPAPAAGPAWVRVPLPGGTRRATLAVLPGPGLARLVLLAPGVRSATMRVVTLEVGPSGPVVVAARDVTATWAPSALPGAQAVASGPALAVLGRGARAQAELALRIDVGEAVQALPLSRGLEPLGLLAATGLPAPGPGLLFFDPRDGVARLRPLAASPDARAIDLALPGGPLLDAALAPGAAGLVVLLAPPWSTLPRVRTVPLSP